MKKLTKAQEKKLHTALCADDLLYRKYRSLMEVVHKAHEALIERPGSIRSVVGVRDNGDVVRLSIVDITVGPQGTEVVVQL